MGNRKFSSDRTYIAIDLKSFYASSECADRHLDPLTTNLVVADLNRTEKTICLAVSPSLKAHGISGRARLFEVIQRVKEVNAERLRLYRNLLKTTHAENYWKADFVSESFSAPALEADPSLRLSYIVAPPRMQRYEDVSNSIYAIYLKYIDADDIIVYSIDEIFADVTNYLTLYNMTAHELAKTMIREVLYTTGITATAGIGTNLYLAKVAMDIVAKHVEPDRDGVRIAELNEQTYREQLWLHRPLTDFWRVGRGYRKKLEENGMFTMGDICRCSVGHDPGTGLPGTYYTEDFLFRLFGVNAETLIDHAWGYEPCEIKDVKNYRTENQSISSGQVLKEPYDYKKTELIVKEMTDLLVLDLVEKGLVTDQIVLTIGYDRSSIVPRTDISPKTGASPQTGTIPQTGIVTRGGIPSPPRSFSYNYSSTGAPFTGEITTDHYGRPIPKHAHGTENLIHYTESAGGYTSSTELIMKAVLNLFHRIMDKNLLSRRINVVACRVKSREAVKAASGNHYEQLDLFTDYAALEKQRKEEQAKREKEHNLQLAMLKIKKRYGKNAMLMGMNLEEGGTTIERNSQIGGHKA